MRGDGGDRVDRATEASALECAAHAEAAEPCGFRVFRGPIKQFGKHDVLSRWRPLSALRLLAAATSFFPTWSKTVLLLRKNGRGNRPDSGQPGGAAAQRPVRWRRTRRFCRARTAQAPAGAAPAARPHAKGAPRPVLQQCCSMQQRIVDSTTPQSQLSWQALCRSGCRRRHCWRWRYGSGTSHDNSNGTRATAPAAVQRRAHVPVLHVGRRRAHKR